FFLVFAGGWLLITLLSTITEANHRPILWPLFPAGGMALFGGLLLAGDLGLKTLDLLGQGWPIALIVVGLYLALRRNDLKK
ncbi:MAG TPA: hypothetical protein VHO48_05735, partial [Anaerolineaceae bacterium]|nr:hypothetical protein [Anaerolineaceae bacterium]